MAEAVAPAIPPASAPAKGLSLTTLAVAAIVLTVLMQVELVFGKSVNWDEYLHYSLIHKHFRGEDVQWLQTPFVQLYGWVPGLPGSTVDHIQLIRLMQLPFELLTLAVIFDSVRRMAGKHVALVTTLAYLTGGYIFLHAFALRADIIATALFMAALWIALWRPLRLAEIAAVLVLGALAYVATIKTVLLAPAFLGVLLMRREELPWLTNRLILAIAGGSAAVLGALAFSGISPQLSQIAASSWNWMFSAGLFPQGVYLSRQILNSVILAVLVLLTPMLLWKGRKTIPHAGALACFLLPVLSVAIYRNSYPYYYCFIMAPAMISLAPAVKAGMDRYGGKALVLFLVLNAAVLSLMQDRSVTANQQAIEAGVREIFPQPVHYIDEAGVIGDYPRTIARFSSGWALAGYRAQGIPQYTNRITELPTPMLIRNTYALDRIDEPEQDGASLLPEDARTLSENFVQHWGEVYVAGRHVAAGTAPETIMIYAPGPYTVEEAALVIDGLDHQPGDVVTLAQGEHDVIPSPYADATLRYGDHLPRPDHPWPDGDFFTAY